MKLELKDYFDIIMLSFIVILSIVVIIQYFFISELNNNPIKHGFQLTCNPYSLALLNQSECKATFNYDDIEIYYHGTYDLYVYDKARS